MNRKTKALAKMVSRMARDGEEEALEEVLAELIGEEIPAEIPAAAPAADPEPPVVVETPVDQPVIIDCGPEILAALQQIISLLTASGADCGGSCRQRDEDPDNPEASENPVEAPAVAEATAAAAESTAESVEALAEAIALTAAEALGISVPAAEPEGDPFEELVEEIMEGDPAEPEGEEEILSTVIDPEDVLDEDPDNPDDPAASCAADRADRLRCEMAVFRPDIMAMPAKDRKGFNRRVIARMKKLRTQAGQDGKAYAAIRARTPHAPDDRDLGRKIMESRNANMRK